MLEDPQTDNYAFLLNVRGFVDFESIEVIPGHELRRATEIEVAEIQRTVAWLTTSGRQHISNIWQARWNEAHTATEALPQHLWRYFVIAFRGNNGLVNELKRACCVSSVEPDMGPTIMRSVVDGLVVAHGPIHNPAHFFQSTEYLLNAGEPAFVDLARADIDELRTIWQTLNGQGVGAPVDIQNLVRRIYQLKNLPVQSPMTFLGYFAILESLLTHSPQPLDPYDSITRQVKKKMTLLNNRFPHRLDYTPFGGAEPETVWTRLYKYRSLIAHGGEPRIEGDLALLQSPRQAFSFLRSATKAVARQALQEPQLLKDLQDC